MALSSHTTSESILSLGLEVMSEKETLSNIRIYNTKDYTEDCNNDPTSCDLTILSTVLSASLICFHSSQFSFTEEELTSTD